MCIRDRLEAAGTISTRGLKQDATHYCELVFDVNSAYFDTVSYTHLDVYKRQPQGCQR